MILTPAERTDSMFPDKLTKSLTVLHGSHIFRQLLATANRAAVCVAQLELVHPAERNEDRDHECARTAHPRGLRQVTADDDIRANERCPKVSHHPPRHGGDIRGPVPWPRRHARERILQHRLIERLSNAHVIHAQAIIPSRGRRYTDSALRGTEEASSACIIRMLSEQLDASWHPRSEHRAGIGTTKPQQLLAGTLDQSALALRLRRAHPCSDQSRSNVDHGLPVSRSPAPCYSLTLTRSSRAVTSGTSLRRERSNTAASA